MCKSQNIVVEIVKKADLPSIAELYKLGGWWNESSSLGEIPFLIKGSFAFVVAEERKNRRIVGMGRVISDGVSDAYIQDVIVHPDYRGLGIGEMIVKKLKLYCLEHGICWIGLIAEPGTEEFYKKLGFKKMKGCTPMLFLKE